MTGVWEGTTERFSQYSVDLLFSIAPKDIGCAVTNSVAIVIYVRVIGIGVVNIVSVIATTVTRAAPVAGTSWPHRDRPARWRLLHIGTCPIEKSDIIARDAVYGGYTTGRRYRSVPGGHPHRLNATETGQTRICH
jgi:hypothetical protein